MKKAFIYLFLPFILLNSSAYELLKTPMLVSHYLSHREASPIGIFQFIAMHYFGNDVKDQDDEGNSKLPFKKINANAFVHFNVPLTPSGIKLKRPCYHLFRLKLIPSDSSTCNPSPDSFFKPPQA